MCTKFDRMICMALIIVVVVGFTVGACSLQNFPALPELPAIPSGVMDILDKIDVQPTNLPPGDLG